VNEPGPVEAALLTLRMALEPPADRLREDEDGRGFEWSPHAHAQRARAGEPRADGACVVTVETRLLSGVTGRAPELAALAWRNARDPGLSALRWDSTSGEVTLRAAAVVRPGDGGAPARRLAHAALLQLGEALRAAEGFGVEFPGATPIVSRDAAGAEWTAVEQASAWQAYADEAAGAAEACAATVAALPGLSPAPWRAATAAPHGLDAEIPCTTTGAGPAALLRMSARQPHPRLGAGLVVVLALPPEAEPELDRAPATAMLLNEGEAREWTGADALGGWCVHPAAGLAHALYMPAVAVEDDTAAVLAWQAGLRARWAMGFLERVARLRKPSEGGSGA